MPMQSNWELTNPRVPRPSPEVAVQVRWGMNWWLPILFIGTSAMFIQGQAFYKVWGLKVRHPLVVSSPSC
jgi:hypothetical protein